MLIRRGGGWAIVIAVALAATLSCGTGVSALPASPAGDNAAIQQAFERHGDEVQRTARGTVDRVLSDQDGPSGPHERFIVRLADVGMTVLIEHNLSLAPRVPVAVGQPVVVHGEYIWNAQGGLIHFTHRDPDGRHEGGYVLYAGKRYD